MVHVCWHRNTSVSMVDFSIAVEVRGGEREAAWAGFPPSLELAAATLCHRQPRQPREPGCSSHHHAGAQ